MDRLDVLVPALTLEADESALRFGAMLAVRHSGTATALIVAIWLGSEYAHTQSPLSDALADLVAGAKSAAASERAKLTAWIQQHSPDLHIRDATVESAAARDEILAHARLADLVIISRAGTHDRARRELIEDILFKSGRPLMLLPASFHARQLPERILIGWNASASAIRAVMGAMPLLRAAAQVRIVTVDAVPSAAGHGEAPGRDLAVYLARRGVRAEVSNLDGLGREHPQRLEEAALDFDADLIVAGAYGHSRLCEFVLGGVTRTLLADSSYPLLLAH